MFQQQVYKKQAPGVIGAKASTNPVQNVFWGPGGLVAGSGGAKIGAFGWINASTGQVDNSHLTGSKLPDGFLANQLQAQITLWLNESTLIVQAGTPVTLYDRGDFYTKTPAQANIDDKVFVNLTSGNIYPGAAGSDITAAVGSDSAFVGSLTAGGNTLTIASVTSGLPAIGHKVSGPGLTNAYIYEIGSFNGTSGTVYLTQNASATETSKGYTSAAFDTDGGWVGTASFATDVMTVATTTSGKPVVGAIVTSASVAAGTYITTDNGDGTYNLSTSPGTITAQAASTTVWVETPWVVKSNGNAGDLVAIGIKN